MMFGLSSTHMEVRFAVRQAMKGLRWQIGHIPPAPPPTWSSSGAAVRDLCMTFLLSRQKVCLG